MIQKPGNPEGVQQLPIRSPRIVAILFAPPSEAFLVYFQFNCN